LGNILLRYDQNLIATSYHQTIAACSAFLTRAPFTRSEHRATFFFYA